MKRKSTDHERARINREIDAALRRIQERCAPGTALWVQLERTRLHLESVERAAEKLRQARARLEKRKQAWQKKVLEKAGAAPAAQSTPPPAKSLAPPHAPPPTDHFDAAGELKRTESQPVGWHASFALMQINPQLMRAASILRNLRARRGRS